MPFSANPLLQASLLIIASELMFATMGALVRFGSEQMPLETLAFFRNLFGVLLLLPWILANPARSLTTGVFHLHLLRAVSGLAALYCFFYAIAHMPLANAMLLKLTAPLFIPFVAFFWLHESLSRRVLLAVTVGFAGVALILTPDFDRMAPIAAVALLGGVLAAVAKTTVRRLSRSEPTLRIVFYFAALALALSLPPFLLRNAWPSGDQLLLLAFLALAATAGQLLLTRAYALAPAGRVGAFTYTSVIFAAAYGWLFWDEVIAPMGLAGSLLVVLAAWMAGRNGKGGAVANSSEAVPTIAQQPHTTTPNRFLRGFASRP